MKIGSRIKELRTFQKIKLNALAELAGISRVFLSDIERDNKIPSFETLERIAKALGVELDAFFSPSPIDPSLHNLIIAAKKLTPEQRELLMKLIETISKE